MGEQLKRTGTINLFDTHFGIWEEGPKDRSLWDAFCAGLMRVFFALRGHLYRRGWTLQKDNGVHKLIRDGHYLGRKGDLEAVVECSGRTMKVEFFQNVVVTNRNGGRYDFDKYKLAPQRLQRQMWAEMNALAKWALSVGYHFEPHPHGGRPSIDVSRPIELQIRDLMRSRVHYGSDPLDYFNRSWGTDRFKRGEDGWPTNEDIGLYNRKDRDGNVMSNGDVRYYYHWDKRIGVGRVYTSMNNMWEVWSIDGKSHLSKQASFELFMLGDSDVIHRRKPLTHEQQVSRLRGEIEEASKSGNWKRVATLGKLLDRMAEK